MEEVLYHSYPDTNITKDTLVKEDFPMSSAT